MVVVIRLAALNALLAGCCVGLFLGALGVVVLFLRSRVLLPFPLPLLLTLYAGAFLVAWLMFVQRLPECSRGQALLANRPQQVSAEPVRGAITKTG